MAKRKEFREGDKVVKARRYSADEYCKYGGTEWEVPIGTEGTIINDFGSNKVEVSFENDKTWSLHTSELDLVKGFKPKPENLTKYMVYGTGCNNKSELVESEKELKEMLKVYTHDSDWTGRIIGYKLVPLYEAEKSIRLSKIKVKK